MICSNLRTYADHLLPECLESTAHAFDPAAPVCLRSELIEALGDLNIWPIEISSGEDGSEIFCFMTCIFQNLCYFLIVTKRKRKRKNGQVSGGTH